MTNRRIYLIISVLVLILSFRMYQVALEAGYWREFCITFASLIIIGAATAYYLRDERGR